MNIFTFASSMFILSTLPNLHVRYYFSTPVPFTFYYSKFCMLFCLKKNVNYSAFPYIHLYHKLSVHIFNTEY